MSGQPPAVPRMFDCMGGLAMFARLTETFHARVPRDPVLAPVFRDMPSDRPAPVALFVAQVSDRRTRVSVHTYVSRQILP